MTVFSRRQPGSNQVQSPRWPSLPFVVLWLVLAVLPLSAQEATETATETAAVADPMTALSTGNQHFREGQLAEAVAAYEKGYVAGAAHPTLVYNLGTTLHHLDRLPEAILWYRRAGDSDDAWLHENLWLARRTLGSQALPPGGLDGLLTRHRSLMAALGMAAAWLTLGLVALGARVPRWTWITTGVLALVLYGASMATTRWASEPAVLLRDCTTQAGELPAGTEAWVRRQDDGQWRVAAEATALCPADAVALVWPRT